MYRSIELVNNYYNSEIRKLSRKRVYAMPRQVYLYCMRKATKQPLQKLASSVNLTNHVTVIHAVKAIEDELTYDKQLQEDIAYLLPIMKRFELERLKNYKFNSNEYELAALWLESKDYEIDIKKTGWKKDVREIKTKDLIELLIMYKAEVL